jgi:hypothetical protein
MKLSKEECGALVLLLLLLLFIPTSLLPCQLCNGYHGLRNFAH